MNTWLIVFLIAIGVYLVIQTLKHTHELAYIRGQLKAHKEFSKQLKELRRRLRA